jgi:hypothetical protein
MAQSSAERQRRYIARLKAGIAPVKYQRPKDRRSRIHRWQEYVQGLRDLQAEYQEWPDNLPESLQDTALAEKLQEVCDLDLEALNIDLPRGFGRDYPPLPAAKGSVLCPSATLVIITSAWSKHRARIDQVARSAWGQYGGMGEAGNTPAPPVSHASPHGGRVIILYFALCLPSLALAPCLW